ncbi:MAG: hypothetical protein WC455_20000 [Dehalococcoidia bacterium]|jgi:hypothetical protein
MKRFLILFLLMSAVGFSAVSSSTFTTVSVNSVYYISTDYAPGSRGEHVGLYIEYTKGDESSVNMTIEWYPNFDWASSGYYAIGERASDETAQPVTIKFDTTDKLMFRVKVPAGMSRLYVTFAYVGGTTGTFKINGVPERL